ncbi:MAG TPA: DUF2283 domain-containing protein [Streptosporangiaceae bacterium]|jgi:uncharacterized protein YuzE|nr:DUF2283 domain-containing protein [Streptosporangiaceae bacterium]
MHVIEDEKTDALYIYLDDGRPAATRQIEQGTIVDLDADGRLIGIGVICRHRAWPVEEILGSYAVSEADETRLRRLAGLTGPG